MEKKRIQMFDCEDIMGDYKIVLFSEEAVEVLYAPGYRYVEILGLPKEEYDYLFKKYGYWESEWWVMVDKDKLICPYCYEEHGHIRGKVIHTYNLKPTAGYKEPTNYKDCLDVFILKGKEEKYAGLMIDNMNGARYVDIRYCPFCGRKLYKYDIKRECNKWLIDLLYK